MVRLETETDIETLRQAAILYQREYKKLMAKMAEMMKEIAKLKGEGEKGAQLRIAALEEQLAVMQQKLFGESSEKRPAAEEGTKPAEEKKPRKGHGPRAQPALPVREVIHTLDEADKACPCCGGAMREWEGQFEESEEINIIRRKFEIVKHKRQKYRCKCNGSIETAPGPQKLHEGARYSIDFAIEVAAAKYLEHMPLERQVRSMEHDGLIIDSQTLWDQTYTVALILKPGYDRLFEHQLTMPLLGADETTWRLLERNGKPSGSKRCFVWCNVSANAVYYKILASRSAAAGEEVLKGYHGIVMADGYGAYPSMSETIGFTLASCWAHVRREFIKIEDFFPKPVGEIIDLIRQLYAIEKQCPLCPDGEEQRRHLRVTESKAVTEKIRAWAMSTIALPQSGLGKAIQYMLGRWEGLTRFLNDTRIPLDNNATERAMRHVVIGRKNHYGSHSERGLFVASVLYSLIDTAVLEGLDPREYLRIAIHRALRGEQVPLPHEVAAELRHSGLKTPAA